MRINKTLVKQFHCILITLFAYRYLSQLYAAELVLRRHLAFAALPRVEDVAVEQRLGLLVAASLVEQGYLFEQQVVPLVYQRLVFLQVGKPLGVRTLHALVKLVAP